MYGKKNTLKASIKQTRINNYIIYRTSLLQNSLKIINSSLFDACFNRTGLRSIVCFSFHTCAVIADFSISPFFYISKVFFNPSFQILISFLAECYLSIWNSKDFWWRICFAVWVLCCGVWRFCWIYYVPMDGK